jgi:hypothetical protein
MRPGSALALVVLVAGLGCLRLPPTTVVVNCPAPELDEVSKADPMVEGCDCDGSTCFCDVPGTVELPQTETLDCYDDVTGAYICGGVTLTPNFYFYDELGERVIYE